MIAFGCAEQIIVLEKAACFLDKLHDTHPSYARISSSMPLLPVARMLRSQISDRRVCENSALASPVVVAAFYESSSPSKRPCRAGASQSDKALGLISSVQILPTLSLGMVVRAVL